MSTHSSNLRTIFISHALPEDNTFVSWLASRLSLLGYDVWCEIVEQSGGEDFWLAIENVIANQAAKVIAVVSKSSVSPSKRGFRKELAAADQVQGRGDFIIPVKVDDTPFSDVPIELKRLNTIDFSQGWASGLKQLQKKLEKDNVPRLISPKLDIQEMVLESLQGHLLSREEKYWTNWVEFSMPEKLYIHYLTFPKQKRETTKFPVVFRQDFVVSFACEECLGIPIKHTVVTSPTKFTENKIFRVDGIPTDVKDPNRLLIELLNEIFEDFLEQSGLIRAGLSNRSAFYFSKQADKHTTVNMRVYRRRFIQLTGDKDEFTWHFALSGSAFLFPVKAFSINYHVFFSQNGQLINKRKQHTLGRGVRKDWYNKKWRDLVLGSLKYLAKDDIANPISIQVDCQQQLLIQPQPISFTSPIGYQEPTKTNE